MTAYVYEVYDREQCLIYVGSTGNVFARLEQHVTDSWWIGQLVKVRASVYPTISAARAEERRRIAALHPRWNLHMLPARRTWTQQQYHDYLTASSRTGSDVFRSRRAAFRRMAVEYRYRFGAELFLPPSAVAS